jgi:hypothetical protein
LDPGAGLGPRQLFQPLHQQRFVKQFGLSNLSMPDQFAEITFEFIT